MGLAQIDERREATAEEKLATDRKGISVQVALQKFGEAVSIGSLVGFNAIASGAIAFLAGHHGWDGEKVEAKVIKERILTTIGEDAGRKKSTAYKWANTAFRLAGVLNKDHKELLEQLATFDGDTAEAVSLVICYVKAIYGVETLGAFEEALLGVKGKAQKGVGELLAGILKKAEGVEWSKDDHSAFTMAAASYMSVADINAMINGLQAVVAQANAAAAAIEAEKEERNAALARAMASARAAA